MTNICIIDKVLESTKLSVLDVLQNNNNMSIMNELLQKSPLKKLLHRNKFIKNICFINEICLPIVGNLKNHFNQLLKSNKFTIHIFENDFFDKMNPLRLSSLKRNKKLREEFLLQHIFLGILKHNQLENNSRLLAVSAKKREPVSEWLFSDGKPIVSKPGESVFVVEREMKVQEGLVQILRLV